MGSRRGDNRLSVSVGPTAVALHHAKQHHEKRNHELLKRLASSESTAKTPPVSKGLGDPSAMTKSLTLEVGKGHLDPESSSVGKARTRKKADVEKALKNLQRQTSSSAMKMMSLSLNDKDQFVDNRMSKNRDPSPSKRKGQMKDKVKDPVKLTKKKDSVNGRSSNPVGHGADKKGGGGGGSPVAGENIKRSDVFERLSRQDCNKGVAKSEHGTGNRIRDRSPAAKTGRRSPQEAKMASDKNPTSRGLSMKTTQNKKRDGSPAKKEENSRKSVEGSQGIKGKRKITREDIRNGSPDADDDKDGSREKLEKDNVPESPDKDTKDLEVSEDVDRIVLAASGVVNGNEIPALSLREVVGGISVGGGEGGRETLNASLDAKQGRKLEGTPTTNLSKKLDPKVPSPDKSSRDKVMNTSKVLSQISPSGPCKSSSLRNAEIVPHELSKAEVMQKVRQRVNDDDKKASKNVIDDDKDVCEAEKCEEDEFYKIKVQTRLVSYSNSTLVIKNTSKVDGVGDYAEDQAGDTASESSHPPSPPPPPHTLQTSSMALPAVPDSDDVEANGATSLSTEAHQGDSSSFTRSRSMRQKFSQFVSKGKTFLSDVYSATQTKLEHYTKGDSSPCSSTSCSITSLEDEKISPVGVLNDNDSGYYSINTSPEVMRPSLKEITPGETACLQKGTCEGGMRADQRSPMVLLPADGSSYGVDTPDNGMKIAGNVIHSDSTQREDDKNVLTAETTNVNEGDDDDDEDELPAIPPPHVNFTLNEEWIKKNILCTCKCTRSASKTKTIIGNSTSASQTSDDKLENINANTVVVEKQSSLEHDDRELESEECINSETSTANPTKDLDDLCLCSCHDGEEGQQHQQLPQEVQEILDADHARMWWTITGNFGNILPIDWSKTYTRQQYLPVLNLNEAKEMTNATEENDRSADDDAEEEEVAQDLDLHHLILNGLNQEPVKSAEEVIREIDDIMQEGSSSEDEGVEDSPSSGANSNETPTHPLPPPLYAEKLNNMSIGELNEAYMELEIVIRQYSETLINQLALRDELEYEKELKNSFISLLLQVQNKRRNFNVEKKKQKKYLTTVIPYDVGHGPPQNETLQILIKILMAINEDSPTVPTLLTDYILKVLCPS